MFTAVALDPKYKTYVVHIASLSFTPLIASLGSTLLNVHLFRRPQISSLIAKKAFIKVSNKYTNFADVFSLDPAFKLSKYIEINDHAIKIVDGQQPPSGPIYSLEQVKLKTLKAYIETNLANGFIKPSKSLAGTLILFDRKSDGFFQLCVNYRGFNDLTIKNQYPLLLI